MKWIETKVVFESNMPDLATDLISEAFYDLGLGGLVIEADAVIGYFPKNDLSDDRLKQLSDRLEDLKTESSIVSRIIRKELDEENWAESWKEYFYPEKIGEKIVVKPTWREYLPKPDDIVVEIDPGMAFGTGAHATTSLCVRMIEKYLKPGQQFLDVGTGSGILMIVAAKLGANKVVGVDNDEVAVEIAEQNLRLNHIGAFSVSTGDLVSNIREQFDIIAANILSEVIVVLLDDIRKVLKENGIFIASGIIVENKDKVIDKMTQTGFEIAEVVVKDQWACIVGINSPK